MSSHTTVFYIHSSTHGDGLSAWDFTQRMRECVAITQQRNIEKRMNKRLTFLSFSPLLLALWSHMTRCDQPTFWSGATRIRMKRLAYYLHLLLCGPVCETEHKSVWIRARNKKKNSQYHDFISKNSHFSLFSHTIKCCNILNLYSPSNTPSITHKL